MSRENQPTNGLYELAREFYKNRKEHILFIFSLLIAAVISVFLLDYFLDLTTQLEADQLQSLDETATKWIFSYRSESFTPVVKVITDLGDVMAYVFLVPVIGLLLYYTGNGWRMTIQGFIVLLSASLLNIWIKDRISRPRPLPDLRLVEAHSFSFPSGHSMSAIAFYGFLVYLTWKLVKNIPLRIGLILLEVFLILGIGLSRVYLGVHYPSDVLAGFAAGLFWLMVCIALFRAINFYRAKSELPGR